MGESGQRRQSLLVVVIRALAHSSDWKLCLLAPSPTTILYSRRLSADAAPFCLTTRHSDIGHPRGSSSLLSTTSTSIRTKHIRKIIYREKIHILSFRISTFVYPSRTNLLLNCVIRVFLQTHMLRSDITPTTVCPAGNPFLHGSGVRLQRNITCSWGLAFMTPQRRLFSSSVTDYLATAVNRNTSHELSNNLICLHVGQHL